MCHARSSVTLNDIDLALRRVVTTNSEKEGRPLRGACPRIGGDVRGYEWQELQPTLTSDPVNPGCVNSEIRKVLVC